MPARCVFKRTKEGKFRFRMKGSKCFPSPSTAKRHAKLYGSPGSSRHKAHAKAMYDKRLANLKKARAARGSKSKASRPNTHIRF